MFGGSPLRHYKKSEYDRTRQNPPFGGFFVYNGLVRVSFSDCLGRVDRTQNRTRGKMDDEGKITNVYNVHGGEVDGIR